MGNRGKIVRRVLLAVAALVLTGALVYSYMGDGRTENPDTTALAEEDFSDIEGNYRVKLSCADSTAFLSCQVTRFSDNGYQMYMVTDKGPKYFTFNVNMLGGLYSEEFGEGVLERMKDLNITRIIFKKENSTCELTK